MSDVDVISIDLHCEPALNQLGERQNFCVTSKHRVEGWEDTKCEMAYLFITSITSLGIGPLVN